MDGGDAGGRRRHAGQHLAAANQPVAGAGAPGSPVLQLAALPVGAEPGRFRAGWAVRRQHLRAGRPGSALLRRHPAAGRPRRAVHLARRAAAAGVRRPRVALVPVRGPGDVRLRPGIDWQPLRRAGRGGDLRGRAEPHRTRDAPRAAVDGVPAADRARHRAPAARRGAWRLAHRRVARRAVPVLHLLRRVHDHRLAGDGRDRVAAHAAAPDAGGGRAGSGLADRRRSRRWRLRPAVSARTGHRRRPGGRRSRSLQRHPRELCDLPALQPALGVERARAPRRRGTAALSRGGGVGPGRVRRPGAVGAMDARTDRRSARRG